MQDDLTPPEAETLRDKVDAAKARLAARTESSKSVQAVKGLIEEHPVASVAAGILLGALVARALPRLGGKSDAANDAAGGLRKSAAGLASVAGKLAIDYATRARDAGRDGLHKVEEVSETVSEKIAGSTEDARRKAIDLSEIVRSAAVEASEAALRKVNELTSRMKH